MAKTYGGAMIEKYKGNPNVDMNADKYSEFVGFDLSEDVNEAVIKTNIAYVSAILKNTNKDNAKESIEMITNALKELPNHLE